ncbi:hypothetical protein CSO98_004998, partial [Salmonella enterica subsp. diarizonae]|nr:hypothetical protein [Salmonella enterica subsp. diarizonae]
MFLTSSFITFHSRYIGLRLGLYGGNQWSSVFITTAQSCTVIACCIWDDMHFLLYQVRFPDGDEEPADIQTVDVVQVQGSHDVQTGTTARGFHSMGFLSGGHP